MKLDSKTPWFIELCSEAGTALSYRVTEHLAHEKTPYQTIDIYETESFGRLMAIDGFIMLTSRDNFLYHDMMSHPVLFTHPNPKNVAIIGGGDCGTLQQVLQHKNIEQVTQIEIDEQVTELSKKYFPELTADNNSPRATLLFDDGLAWMKSQPENSLDVIIVDSTDPIGPAEGLFGPAFFADCKKALKPDGILVQQSESPIIHLNSIINPLHEAMRSSGFNNIQLLNFPQPCYPSGWWSATMASPATPLNSFRENDSKNKSFATRYYNSSIHKAALAMPEFVKQGLKT